MTEPPDQAPQWPPPPSGNLPPLHPDYEDAPGNPSRGASKTKPATIPGPVPPPDETRQSVTVGGQAPGRRTDHDQQSETRELSGEPPTATAVHTTPTSTPPLPPTGTGQMLHPTAPIGLGAPGPQTKPAGSRSRRGAGLGAVLGLSLLATFIGAAIALGVVWATIGFDENGGGTRVVQQGSAERVISDSGLDTIGVADSLRPSIVNVQIAGTAGQGSGSGVIYDSNGLIMTNNHVVQGAREIRVELTDGRTLDADVLGGDAETDIAVLRVDANELPPAKLGTATTLKIGEPVVAVGNPLGLQGGPTVTVGYVSALGRNVQVSANSPALVDMIQTDASIAEGSSGGALVNGDGAVIGITTAIAVAQSGAGDIGFATPIDIAVQVADQLVSDGKAQHPFLGVRGTDVDVTSEASLGVESGALILDVEPNTPAAEAGLQQNDVVTAVDGDPVTSMAGLIVALRSHQVGDAVELTIVRDGSEQATSVALGEKP